MKGRRQRAGLSRQTKHPDAAVEKLFFLQILQNFRWMCFCIRHWNPVFFDNPVRSDQSRGTNRPLYRFTLSIFSRAPRAVSLHRLKLRIREQNKRQIEFGDKLIMRIDAVAADADDNGIRLGHRFDSVAEPARLFGSTRGIVLRIKPKHDIFSRIVAQ